MEPIVSPLINPWKQLTCPACGTHFYPGECAIYSGITADRELEPARQGLMARTFVKPLVGKYTLQQAHRRCPECKINFPYNIERAQNYTIAIIGDVSAGKSHYIAACIEQLKYYSLHVMGYSQMEPLNNTYEEFENNYYRPVFVNRQQMPPTQPAISRNKTVLIPDNVNSEDLQRDKDVYTNTPLIYELVPRNTKSTLFSPKNINLMFYDASGEDIAQKERMVQYSSYIVQASAIIFLVDPLTMPKIVQELPRYLQPKHERRSSVEVFQRVIHTFKNYNQLHPGVPIKTPIAIAVSKSDLLRYVTKKQRQMPFFLQKDSEHNNGININDFKQTDEEVQDFLRQYGDTRLLDMTKNPNNSNNASFEDLAFFALSATGSSPDESTGLYPHIEPRRCLDPLLWALWKLNVIEA